VIQSGRHPLVTIAIPTFNRASTYLPRALDAAIRQTYANLDVLVADNASTDATIDAVHALKDSRVRYHRHEENVGSAGNTNYCISASRGEYTLLLNDDDLIDPGFVAVCIDALENGVRPGLIRTGMRVIDESGATIRVHPNRVAGLSFADFVVAWTEGLTTPYLCSTLFKTEPLQRSGMHSRHYLWDDVITELRIAAVHGRVDIEEIYASSCEHGGALTRAADPHAWCQDSLDLLELACSLAPEDAPRLRMHLVPFLAGQGYRRAAEANTSLRERLHGGWTVYRSFGVAPQCPGWLMHVLSKEPWYRYLARVRHGGRGAPEAGR
jgi:hypothetical protein